MVNRSTSGDLVRAWRERKGLTLDEIAAMTGLSRSALSRIENNEQHLRADDMLALVAAFGTTVGRFYAAKIRRGA